MSFQAQGSPASPRTLCLSKMIGRCPCPWPPSAVYRWPSSSSQPLLVIMGVEWVRCTLPEVKPLNIFSSSERIVPGIDPLGGKCYLWNRTHHEEKKRGHFLSNCHPVPFSRNPKQTSVKKPGNGQASSMTSVFCRRPPNRLDVLCKKTDGSWAQLFRGELCI